MSYMATRAKRKSRVLTISLPEDLAKQARRIARQESRNISELFREALRLYAIERTRMQLRKDFEPARPRIPHGYKEADVERLVHEVRAEMANKTRT